MVVDETKHLVWLSSLSLIGLNFSSNCILDSLQTNSVPLSCMTSSNGSASSESIAFIEQLSREFIFQISVNYYCIFLIFPLIISRSMQVIKGISANLLKTILFTGYIAIKFYPAW